MPRVSVGKPAPDFTATAVMDGKLKAHTLAPITGSLLSSFQRPGHSSVPPRSAHTANVLRSSSTPAPVPLSSPRLTQSCVFVLGITPTKWKEVSAESTYPL
ncbi:unnamed protein product, partial [Aureobasidium pullulans]